MSNFLVVFALVASCIFAFGFENPSKSSLAPPIVGYTTNRGAVEYLQAQIDKEHLDTGTIVTQEVRHYIRGMGTKNDDAGHLVARRLGGTGRVTYNFVPQNLRINRGIWRTSVEDPIYNEVKNNVGPVKFEVWPRYETPEDLRPFEIKYLATRPNGSVLIEGVVPNPKDPEDPTSTTPHYHLAPAPVPVPLPLTTLKPTARPQPQPQPSWPRPQLGFQPQPSFAFPCDCFKPILDLFSYKPRPQPFLG